MPGEQWTVIEKLLVNARLQYETMKCHESEDADNSYRTVQPTQPEGQHNEVPKIGENSRNCHGNPQETILVMEHIHGNPPDLFAHGQVVFVFVSRQYENYINCQANFKTW